MGVYVGGKGACFVVIYIVMYFQVKLRNDMPDDMLKDAIETSRRVLNGITDFDTQGLITWWHYSMSCNLFQV